MKKILISLLIMLMPLSIFADVTVYGEVKGSGTTNFSKEDSTGEDTEFEARIGAKGSVGITTFDVQLKATDYGFNGDTYPDYADGDEDGDDSERTYPFFEQAYFTTDIAEYLSMDELILDVTAGLFKVESLRKARYSHYENEDISTLTRDDDKETNLKIRVNKDWTSPNLMLNAGIPLIRFRGGLNIEETEDDSFEFLAGITGGWKKVNYEAYYFSTGLNRDDSDSDFENAIMASVYSEEIDIESFELETGLNYVYTFETELHSFGAGASLSEKTFLPLELNFGIDGSYNTSTEDLNIYELAIDFNAEVTDFLTLMAGTIIDFRDYSENLYEPSPLRVLDFCANFNFFDTELGIGYAHIFDYNIVDEQETIFSYAEDAYVPNFYINIKTKF